MAAVAVVVLAEIGLVVVVDWEVVENVEVVVAAAVVAAADVVAQLVVAALVVAIHLL